MQSGVAEKVHWTGYAARTRCCPAGLFDQSELLIGPSSSTIDNIKMEEKWKEGVYERTRPPAKRRILTAFIALVFFVLIALRVPHGMGPLLRRTFTTPRPQVPCHHHNSASKNEFRLVEVHRAGVGKRRNQVYQVLNVAEDSTFHTLDGGDGKYYVPSMSRQTTHLADRSRQATKQYITQSRLRAQALRDAPLSPLDFQSPAAQWISEDIQVPNITNMHVVTTLAKVSSNAYIRIPDTEDWYDLGKKWNESHDFGWEEYGLRGHVFANEDNSTIIVAMKGTSPPFVGGSDTSTNDKINDNLLFSCCCARVSYMWSTVCDCYTGDTYKCNLTCLENEVASESHYYHTALDIYYNVTTRYPNATMWLTGHSLGGSLASLVGLTFGVPTVTYEAPPERMASQRLHLPTPPALKPEDMLIWHFGHTADPIYMGICTGPSSPCWYAGYAMESTCHTGFECVYDTVTDLGWRVSLTNHRIKPVVNDVLSRYNNTPNCTVVQDCVDCYQWNFVD